MDYLTNYYKNLSEQLQQRRNVLSNQLKYLKENIAITSGPPGPSVTPGPGIIPGSVPGQIGPNSYPGPGTNPYNFPGVIPGVPDPAYRLRQLQTAPRPRRPGQGGGGGGGQGGGGQGGGGGGGGGGGDGQGGGGIPPEPPDGPDVPGFPDDYNPDYYPPGFNPGPGPGGWTHERYPGGIRLRSPTDPEVPQNLPYEHVVTAPDGTIYYWDGTQWKEVPSDWNVYPIDGNPQPINITQPPPPPDSPDNLTQEDIERGIRDWYERLFGKPPLNPPGLPPGRFNRPITSDDLDYPYGFPPLGTQPGLTPDDPDFPLPPWWQGAPPTLNKFR